VSVPLTTHAADENDRRPTPQEHVDAFLYLMSDDCDENGEMLTPA